MSESVVPVVIVGGGICGVSCAEQLASQLPSVNILLISASPIIKAVTQVWKSSIIMEELEVKEKPFKTLETTYNNIQVIIDPVTSLNTKEHKLQLASGRVIFYKKLCLCSGAVPKLISADLPCVLGIRDTHTIEMFQKKLSDARRVVIVGNGGIATELVHEIENCEIVWIVRDKSISATFFDAGAAEFFQESLSKEKPSSETTVWKRIKYSVEKTSDLSSNALMGGSLGPDWSTNASLKGASTKSRNIIVHYGCEVISVCAVDEGPWPVRIELSNQETIGCDFVVSATGVEPNTDVFLLGNKFVQAPDGGIRVNDQFQTSEEDVYAAGDVCTPSWEHSKHWFQMRLWTQARQMGFSVASCISADLKGETDVPLDICFDLFTHVTRFFGYKVILLGLFNGQKLGNDYEILLRVTKGKEFVKAVMQDGRMQGAVLIGDTDLEETFENLIFNQLDLSSYGEDLLDPNIDIEDYFD